MKLRCRSMLLNSALVSAMVLVGSSAWAAPPASASGTAAAPSEKDLAEAKSRYKAGLSLFDDGAYEAARVQFERAYELAPSYRILYNVGLVQKQLNEFVASRKALLGYLEQGGAEVPPERKEEVTKLIHQLDGIIAFTTVTVNIPGADITVDDATVGKSPMNEPIALNPGRRKIGAKLAGRIPDAKVITVASGDKVSVDLTLQQTGTTIVKTTDVKPLVAWIVTGALAVGTGVTGYLTLKASDDLDDKKATLTSDRPGANNLSNDLDSQRSTMKTFAIVTDILGACTIVSAGVATYFTWFNKPKESDATDKPAETAKVHFTPTLGGGAIFGTF